MRNSSLSRRLRWVFFVVVALMTIAFLVSTLLIIRREEQESAVRSAKDYRDEKLLFGIYKPLTLKSLEQNIKWNAFVQIGATLAKGHLCSFRANRGTNSSFAEIQMNPRGNFNSFTIVPSHIF